MATHDYDIANQSGANFRADLNNVLDAIVSNNSNSSDPSTTFAYMWWVDTSNNVLKLRNSANNAWITLPMSITASNTITPTLNMGTGAEEDVKIVFDGNAQDFYIALDDSEDDLVIGKGSTVGTTPALTIDENLKSLFGGDVEIGTTAPKINLKNTDTSVTADQSLGVFEVESSDGSTGSAGTIAKLDVAASGTFDGSGTGSQFRFSTGATNQSGSIALTEQMRLSDVGNLHLSGGSDRRIQLGSGGAGANTVGNNTVHIRGDGVDMKLMAASGGSFLFEQNGTEAVRINSSRNLLINSSSDNTGVTGGGIRQQIGSSETDGDKYYVAQGGGSNATPFVLEIVGQNLYDSGTTAMKVGRHSGNQRSISAGGTLNASGSDYAEYMKKTDGCGTIAKGDVVGVDANGKLTKTFSDSISFVIKSTDPSYVGGDTWGSVDLNLTKEQYETERQKYDRIAFSGQVPLNITGSFNVGDYVYPQANGTEIQAVAKSTPTFEEYQLCVGKIWTTMDDGRPLVAVKIG